MSACAVSFENVSKRFRLGQSHDSLRDLVASLGRRITGKTPYRPKEFWALRDVDFTVDRGKALGIIGPNGAGKSTTLKLLAGILRPDRGAVRINGRLAALIEIGAGFHGDLTGRENVFLNGAIMGMSRAEIKSKLDAIVDFAGISAFLDMPVKRYSSGMYARLGFSIASHVDPEILLVDEVLSVGDAVFRLRCMQRMRELVQNGTTLIFVTHNLDQMQSICQNAVVLESGTNAYAGDARSAVARYLQAMSRAVSSRPTDMVADAGTSQSGVREVAFLDPHNEPAVWLNTGDPVRCRVDFTLGRSVQRLVVEMNMRGTATDNILSFNTAREGHDFSAAAGDHRIELSVPALPISGGHYFWNLRLWDAQSGKTLLDTPYQYPLIINDDGRSTGVVGLAHSWTLTPQACNARSVALDSSTPMEAVS